MDLINWNFCFCIPVIAIFLSFLIRCVGVLFHNIQGYKSVEIVNLTESESLATTAPSHNFYDSPLRTLLQWKKNGKKMVWFQLGEFRALVLNDVATLKKAFSMSAFNGRPPTLPVILFSGGKGRGTLTTSGDTWKMVRNHTVSNLSKSGFGAGPWSEYSVRQLKDLVEELNGKCGIPLDLRPDLYDTITACVWHSLIGDEMHKEDREKSREAFMDLYEYMWEPITNDIWFKPSLVSAKHPEKIEKLKAVLLPFQNIVTNEITQSLEQGKVNFLTSFAASLKKDGISQEEIEMHLHGTVMNLFHTAAEAVSNVLRWAILYLTLYPDIQQKLAKEILSKEGDLEELNEFPYLKAVVKEVLRISSSAPFANFHYTVEDTEIIGTAVPRGTVVIGNLYGIHHDPRTFSDPETFKPERFLSSEAKSRGTIPFSLGLRACLGQGFAKNFTHRALAILMKEFAFSWDPSVRTLTENDITDLSNVSVFRFTPPFKVVLMKRKDYCCT